MIFVKPKNEVVNHLNSDTPHAADPEFEEQQPGVIGGDRKTDKDQWRQPVHDHFTTEQHPKEET